MPIFTLAGMGENMQNIIVNERVYIASQGNDQDMNCVGLQIGAIATLRKYVTVDQPLLLELQSEGVVGPPLQPYNNIDRSRSQKSLSRR